jgi:hypothetical protein
VLREIALRAAVGALYAVATLAFLRASRGVESAWLVLVLAIGVFGVTGLIHRSILRVYRGRHVSPNLAASQRDS